MKTELDLNRGWQVHQAPACSIFSGDDIAELSEKASDVYCDWIDADMPGQVHEILMAAGRIEDPRYGDRAKDLLWVAECDWVYKKRFAHPRSEQVFLEFMGLDTLADIYLNGSHIAHHQDMYLPLRIDVSDRLKAQNTLLVHFTSPHGWIEKQSFPAEWEGYISRTRLLRKPHEDFNSFNGPYPYLTPVGIYDSVRLVIPDGAELEEIDVTYRLNEDFSCADVTVKTASTGDGDQVHVEIEGPDGALACSGTSDIKDGRASVVIRLENPQLWWPRGFGNQPLYTVRTLLKKDGGICDRAEKSIGFRTVSMSNSFDLHVNGQRIRLWGANLAPLEQLTHVWPEGKFKNLIDLAEKAHMNTLRVWGPGAPYGREVFEEADRRGIFLWIDFYHTWGMYPDTDDYLDLCTKEAEHTVKKLKHHPSVFMWCGGNEVYMSADVMHGGKEVIGRRLYSDLYRSVCHSLDPERFYLENSPVHGAYANDPGEGDSHGYTHHWFVPGASYPVLFSENARWSPPLLKTLRKYIPGDDLWPDGFRSRITPLARKHSLSSDAALMGRNLTENAFIPVSWQKLGKSPQVTGRTGPVGDLHDTGDSPEGLIYRLGTANSLFIRRCVERFRRGYPAEDPRRERRTRGHYWWKLNGTWPQIDSELIDYLNEPKISYYAMRRAYEPLLISFDIGDHICIWLTNDSSATVSGTLRFRLLSPDGTETVREREANVILDPDFSAPVMDLDFIGMFDRRLTLFAELLNDQGRVIARANDFAYEEMNMSFPEAEIRMDVRDGAVELATDRFARSVELQGNADGDEFGWYFEDNFFDMVPGETKRVRILGNHRKGVITAQPFFSRHITRITFQQQEQ